MEAMTYPPGPQHNRSMRDSAIRDRLFAFTMQAEDLPQPTNRIDLDPTIVDAWGFAAGRVTYAPHKHELVASDHFAPMLEAVMNDAGADFAFSTTSPPQGDLDLHEVSPLGIAPASRHVMGTCRMGDDPRTSVVDARGPLPRRREHALRRLVGVRDLGRLQPDADARRTGAPSRVPPR